MLIIVVFVPLALQLRERLALMKATEAEEEERKRMEIAAGKQAKEQLLRETLEAISRHRLEQNTQTRLRCVCVCVCVCLLFSSPITDKSSRNRLHSNRDRSMVMGSLVTCNRS